MKLDEREAAPMAASTIAMDLSEVFIVPMMNRLGGRAKTFVRVVLEVDALVAVLQQVVQLAEDLGEVAAVHLIDDQKIRLIAVALRCRFVGDTPQRPRFEAECHVTVLAFRGR